jgi:Fe-S oxidoreductase
MERVVLTLLIVASLAAFFRYVYQVVSLVRRAHRGFRVDALGRRLGRFVGEVLLQRRVIAERPLPGFFHALVFWGFLAFGLETLDHFFRGYGGTLLGHGAFHAGFRSVVAVFAVLVAVAMLALAFRRFVLRPESLGRFSPGSLLVALFIEILMVTYLLDYAVFEEGSRAAAVNWWVHAGTVLAFLWLIPRSKHFHLVLAPFTTFLKAFRPAPLVPLDFEKEELGAEKFLDLDAHTILGAFTCVECGRCRDHCPATQTGKTLNPKQFILDLRRGLKSDPEAEAVGSFVSETALWQCTTCAACTTQCPVGIEHVSAIIELRRGRAAAGAVPQPMTNLFKGLERSGNPWSYQPQQAEEFLSEHQVPTYDGHEVLYWMGCMARYDAKYQKVALAFMDLLKASGVSWGVLRDETCTGDAARRAGNEFLFQMLAETNIENLKASGARTIVTTCPHCLWTLEEYKDMGLDGGIRIVHHTVFLRELLEAGRLRVRAEAGEVVYHDACYLSRYQGRAGVEAPRELLRHGGLRVREARRHGRRSFCCGAGGGMLFTEETEGERINLARTDELLATGAGVIATACPFCRLMIGDGVTDRGREEVTVSDIAQLLRPAESRQEAGTSS